MIPDNTPIIVGVGQIVQRTPPSEKNFMSALDMAAAAGRAAIADSGANCDIRATIDVMMVSRLFEDSTRKVAITTNPYGASNNVPGSIAKRMGLVASKKVYCAVGGQTPQRLVNQISEQIHRGEISTALLVGGEAIANIKYAIKQGFELDLSETIDEDHIDLWPENNADNMVSAYEMDHGLFLPVQAYPLCEHVWRTKAGHTNEQHRQVMGCLFAPFSQVAAANSYAQFPTARSAEFLAEPSAENYLLSEPYTKWMVAQDSVNQGAAVLLCAAATAREWGIPPSRWVSLYGYGDCDDFNVIERPDLAISQAQNLAVRRALESAECPIDTIAHIDAYSCFPIAVLSACVAMGLSPQTERRLSLTGGLPYFGGPGNNYSMHAIAEAVTRVRTDLNSTALVIANGGYLSKHSAGVYGATRAQEWRAIDSSDLPAELQSHGRVVVTEQAMDTGIVETYVAAYQRGQPALGYILGRQNDERRFLAKLASEDRETMAALFDRDPIGRSVRVTRAQLINTFRFANET